MRLTDIYGMAGITEEFFPSGTFLPTKPEGNEYASLCDDCTFVCGGSNEY